MDSAKVTEVLSNILTLLGLTEDQIVIEVTEEENINISLTVPLDRAGVFVGRHGEGLAALRMIFSLILFQRFAFWPKLHLNVNDYQERREEALRELANNAAQRALDLQKEIILPNLSSYERRIVHMILSEIDGVKTESRGEAPYRQMYIIPV
ncbi:MAG: Jag protein [Candidatus Collierbacteria bacterium GW2011_GWC2_45_15]|uniref:Jag protein n=2 Tax=Candidatus Collieribacteriota TaxID=1752725 RepID=A0A0G1ISI8_9BACT|nr:MAG: Jag protein [Candidatus Collierbacteria bacterium GW2011_GWA1_44_12]KKT97084.1 MAG: Jag protein [Candidatus Collierbacteria bacterium GW2011_GWC2_45_15]